MPFRCCTLQFLHGCSECFCLALKDASARRILSELDEAIKKARHHGFDKNRDELAQEVANAEQLVVRLARLERLRSEVRRVFAENL